MDRPVVVTTGGRSLLVVTTLALLFQLAHLSEHTAQMVMWFVHPQRAAWMSPWAHELSLWLGRIRTDRIAETTTEVQRGMELLHLVGNVIFGIGAVGLHRLVGRRADAGPWSRAALVVQGFHVVEHVALTATLQLTGTAVGLSTGFGHLDGTRLSTYRVWWHGSINLLATALAAMAVARLRSRRPTTAPMLRPVALATVLATLLLPGSVAGAVGRPVGADADLAATPAHHHDAAPVDDLRSGRADGFELVDVAAEVGLDVTHHAFNWDITTDPVAMMGGGLCWLDVDGDGWLDLFVTDTWSDGEWGLWDATGKLPTQHLYRNEGGVFTDRSAEWGVDVATRANGCTAADFDGDGHTDLYVTTARSNLLFWNDGGTGLVEGAGEAGADLYGWHTGAAAGDLDGDGDLDLVVAGYADRNTRRPEASTGFPNMFAPVADVILLNQGPVDDRETGAGAGSGAGRPVFEPAGPEAGLEPDGPEYGLGVGLGDLDGDGDLDLHIANDTQPNRLYRNETSPGGPLRLVEMGAAAGADDAGSGMGVALADLDGDHTTDLLVTNLAGQGHAALLGRPGRDGLSYGPGVDAVRRLGLIRTGWGVSAADLDLDGRVDVTIASGAIPIDDLDRAAEPLTVFCAVGRQDQLVDRSAETGLDRLGDRNGRSVAAADYDNDGDLDLAVSAIGQPLALLQNRGADGHWLALDAGTPSPGLTLRVELASGRRLEATATAGGSWLSSEDPRPRVGLGPDDHVVTAEAIGFDGVLARWTDIPADQVLSLGERPVSRG